MVFSSTEVYHMGSFTVNFYKEDEAGEEQEYEVTGNVSPYRPARTNCSNDDACPAEGGEVEIECVTLGGEVVPLTCFTPDEIAGMEEQLTEAAADDEPDYDEDRDDDYEPPSADYD
jgi:hypothetical protein